MARSNGWETPPAARPEGLDLDLFEIRGARQVVRDFYERVGRAETDREEPVS